MAAFDRSAYPRFPQKISVRELIVRYTPSPEEIEWSRSATHASRLQHIALVQLKCFQQLHYFPELHDIPVEISTHIASAMSIEIEGPGSLGAATRYRQQAAIRRYLDVSAFYGKEGRRIAVRAASEAAPLVNQRGLCRINSVIADRVCCIPFTKAVTHHA